MMGQGSWLEANLELRRRRDEMDAHKFLENSRVMMGRDAVVASVEAYLSDLRGRGALYDPPIFFVDATPACVQRSVEEGWGDPTKLIWGPHGGSMPAEAQDPFQG